MFCNNCGSKLEDGARFCNNCGTALEVPKATEPQPVAQNPVYSPYTQNQQETSATVAYAQSDQTNTYQPQQSAPQYGTSAMYNQNPNLQPPVKAKKSSTGCIVVIIVAIILFVITVIAVTGIVGYNVSKKVMEEVGSDFSDYDDTYDYTTDDDFDSYVVTNLTYEEIFETNNIIDIPSLFLTKETCAFAYAETDGYVEKSEYGYEDDVIMEMVDTYYFPIDGYDKAEADAYLTLTKSEFSAEESLSFCTVTYNTITDYIVVTVRYNDVDNKKNLEKMYEAGLLDDGDIDYLSMEETEENYLDQGFVKK